MPSVLQGLMNIFETKTLSEKPDTHAPDGSEIRFLPQLQGGSMVHGRLPVGMVTQAVRHHRVEELWYILSGKGEIWRKQGDKEEETILTAGMGISIPIGTSFQFRNIGDENFDFVIVTMPPWAGADDAILEENHWER
jgi:mannose-6-phosphate isomerase-like protein (cupin superfamily)